MASSPLLMPLASSMLRDAPGISLFQSDVLSALYAMNIERHSPSVRPGIETRSRLRRLNEISMYGPRRPHHLLLMPELPPPLFALLRALGGSLLVVAALAGLHATPTPAPASPQFTTV